MLLCLPVGFAGIAYKLHTGDNTRVNRGLFVRLESKPGKEDILNEFLQSGFNMAKEDAGIKVWFVLRFGPTTFGVFDAFETEEARQDHLAGAIVAALMEHVEELLAETPVIERVDIQSVKLPS